MEIIFYLALKLLYVYFMYINFDEEAIENLFIGFINYPEEKFYLENVYNAKKFVQKKLTDNPDFSSDKVIEVCTLHVFKPVKKRKLPK